MSVSFTYSPILIHDLKRITISSIYYSKTFDNCIFIVFATPVFMWQAHKSPIISKIVWKISQESVENSERSYSSPLLCSIKMISRTRWIDSPPHSHPHTMPRNVKTISLQHYLGSSTPKSDNLFVIERLRLTLLSKNYPFKEGFNL